MDAAQRHRSMYKSSTPPWKETYRKRCVERLKNSRSRLLEKFRQVGDVSGCSRSLLVQEVMEEEWSALQSSRRAFPSLWSADADGVRDVYAAQQEFDELSAFEEIQQELVAQELLILEEYNRSVRYEEQYLHSVLEGMEEDRRIICPVCLANNLTVNSRFTSCPCGLFINTTGRNVTPEVLQDRLEGCVTEHMEDCLHNPSFSMAVNTDGSPNLMISCKVCDHLSVVL